jgi:hypothetical protein
VHSALQNFVGLMMTVLMAMTLGFQGNERLGRRQ